MSDTDRASLRLVTFDPEAPEPVADAHVCTGYTCEHPDCELERLARVARGVKPRRPMPVKRAA